VDLQDKSKEFLDLYAVSNPIAGARAKVPLLEVEDSSERTVLCESLVVTEYIAERYGVGTLDPPGAGDRAKTRLFTELCSSSFSYWPILRTEGEELEKAINSFKEGLVGVDAFLNRVGKGGPFLLGNRFSIAECISAPFIQRACTILPAFTGVEQRVDVLVICDELGLNRLKEYIEAILVRPSVVSSGVPKDDMVKSTTKMLERFASMGAKK